MLIRVRGKHGCRIIASGLLQTLIFKAVLRFSPLWHETQNVMSSPCPWSNSWPCEEGAGDCLVFCQVCVYRVSECQSATVQKRRWVLSGRSSSPSHSHDGKRLEMRGRLHKTASSSWFRNTLRRLVPASFFFNDCCSTCSDWRTDTPCPTSYKQIVVWYHCCQV
jgi:hypothetical protein